MRAVLIRNQSAARSREIFVLSRFPVFSMNSNINCTFSWTKQSQCRTHENAVIDSDTKTFDKHLHLLDMLDSASQTVCRGKFAGVPRFAVMCRGVLLVRLKCFLLLQIFCQN